MQLKYLTIILGILLLGITMAEVQTLGTFEDGRDIELKQVASSDYTGCNITSVSFPNSSKIVQNVKMSKSGNEYSYNLKGGNTSGVYGQYVVNGECYDGTDYDIWAYDFDVTPSGFSNTIGFYVLIVIIAFAILVLGFSLEDPWIVLLGCFGMIFLGIWMNINGIDTIQNKTITMALSIIIIAVASYISLKTGLEIIQQNY